MAKVRRVRMSSQLKGMLKTNRHKSWRKTLFKMQRGLCHYCGKPMADDVTLDHVIPTSKGGEDCISNTVAAHEICNAMKGDSIYG